MKILLRWMIWGYPHFRKSENIVRFFLVIILSLFFPELGFSACHTQACIGSL